MHSHDLIAVDCKSSGATQTVSYAQSFFFPIQLTLSTGLFDKIERQLHMHGADMHKHNDE